MKTLPVFLLMLILVACNAKHVTNSTKVNERTKDSIVYVDRVTVDTVKFPTETLVVRVPVTVFERDTVVVFKNGRASTKLVYQDKIITIHTQCDSLEKLVLSRDRQLLNLRSYIKESSTETKEKLKKEVPWYYKSALWICLGLILFLIIRFIVKPILLK